MGSLYLNDIDFDIEHNPNRSEVNLRSSQAPAIEMAREKIRAGNKCGVIAAPCGFGKSVVACKFIDSAQKLGRKVWFVVDRQILVNDMSSKLDMYGIPHAVIMADHWRFNLDHRVQVVSIQTAERRGWANDIDVMIVDEAHANMRKSFIDYVQKHPHTKIIGLTATPFHKDMAKIYDYVVNPTTTNKQIEEGFLVPLQIYSCVESDMAGAKIIAGEWADSEVKERGRKIYGDIVKTWHEKTMEKFGKPVKTIVFSADVAHGAEICEAFAAAGFNFQQITHKDNNEDRDTKIEEIRKENSTIDGLVSCGVLTRGFDVTDIQIGIMARPLRKSFSEFIQQIGRIQRAHNGKEFGLLLDHAGNVARFLPEMIDLFENGVIDLVNPPDAKPPRKEPTKKEKLELFCPKCRALMSSDTCTCGFKRVRRTQIETVPGKMVEVVLNGKKLAPNMQNLYAQLCTYTKRHGNPDTAKQRAYYLFKDMTGGMDPAKQWDFSRMPVVAIAPAVNDNIRSKQIAWSKRKNSNG